MRVKTMLRSRAWQAAALVLALAAWGCGDSGKNESGQGSGAGGSSGSGGSAVNAAATGGSGAGVDAGLDGAIAGDAASNLDGGGEGPDGGSEVITFPPDEDADGDGLTNGTELDHGTDPRYRDTDMDGLADGTEVGADPSAPQDSDADGVIDAMENPKFDNDRDGVTDDTDVSDGAQVVYGRFIPAVVANGGSEPVRFELKLAGADVKSASVGMPAVYFRAEWAPDELEVDGAVLGKAALDLFDDGTHGDVIAGDHVFSRGGISTKMAIRSDSGRLNGKRCRVLFNEVSITTTKGTEAVPIGTTDGVMPRVVPDFGFWLPVIDAKLVPKAEALTGIGQHTGHVLNIVDSELALTLEQFLIEREAANPMTTAKRRAIAYSLTSRALAEFSADFDFIYAFTSETVYTSLAVFYFGLANDVTGIGRGVETPAAESGSAGRLRGLLSFRFGTEFPLNHETAHSWGVALQPTLGNAEAHWGTAGANGVLGGFDPATLVDHGGGTFTVGHFSEDGNDWLTTAYSPIELYLMGLVPPSDVTPIPVLDNIAVLSNDASGVTVSATKTTVTIDDVIADQGARIPATADARTDFDALFVIFSDRKLSRAELGLIDHIAIDYEQATSPDGLNFAEATGGRATMTTALPAVSTP